MSRPFHGKLLLCRSSACERIWSYMTTVLSLQRKATQNIRILCENADMVLSWMYHTARLRRAMDLKVIWWTIMNGPLKTFVRNVQPRLHVLSKLLFLHRLGWMQSKGIDQKCRSQKKRQHWRYMWMSRRVAIFKILVTRLDSEQMKMMNYDSDDNWQYNTMFSGRCVR